MFAVCACLYINALATPSVQMQIWISANMQ